MKLALILAAAVALATSARAEKAPAKHRKKAAVKARKKAPESRYKSTALSAGLEEHYRFDEDGNPLDRKRPAAAAKRKAPSSAEPDDEGAGLKAASDADAL